MAIPLQAVCRLLSDDELSKQQVRTVLRPFIAKCSDPQILQGVACGAADWIVAEIAGNRMVAATNSLRCSFQVETALALLNAMDDVFARLDRLGVPRNAHFEEQMGMAAKSFLRVLNDFGARALAKRARSTAVSRLGPLFS